MIKKKLVIFSTITSLLLSILFIGCGGEKNVPSLGIVDLEIEPEKATYYIGGKVPFSAHCHNPKKLPEDPYYYWYLQDPDGDLVIEKHSYNSGGDQFAANAEGNFTLFLKVYDRKDFEKLRTGAPCYGTATATLIAKEIQVEIDTNSDITGKKF